MQMRAHHKRNSGLHKRGLGPSQRCLPVHCRAHDDEQAGVARGGAPEAGMARRHGRRALGPETHSGHCKLGGDLHDALQGPAQLSRPCTGPGAPEALCAARTSPHLQQHGRSRRQLRHQLRARNPRLHCGHQAGLQGFLAATSTPRGCERVLAHIHAHKHAARAHGHVVHGD